MNILILDNYDSFTFNLFHLVKKISRGNVEVVLNDRVDLDDVKKYDKIILSPGPGIPVEAGSMIDLIREYASSKSILGVCLGHQAIAETFGGKLKNLSTVYHGVTTNCYLEPGDHPLFRGLPAVFEVGHYHSWVVNGEDLPKELQVTAYDDNGLIMALQHQSYDVQGVQFHPESVLTPTGEIILRNWINQ